MLNLHFRTILAVALLVAVVQPHEEEIDLEPSCSSTKPEEIMHHLSTKTPYRVVANMDESQPIFAGCRATRIWSVIRHGSRNPSKKHIHQARTELMRLKEAILQTPGTKLCREELARLRFWYFNVTEEEEKFLVAEGEDELIELAERMQNRFPLLLKDSYHPDSYYFKYTKTQRTLESARSFATGLFGRQHINEIIYPEALHKDPVLRDQQVFKT